MAFFDESNTNVGAGAGGFADLNDVYPPAILSLDDVVQELDNYDYGQQPAYNFCETGPDHDGQTAVHDESAGVVNGGDFPCNFDSVPSGFLFATGTDIGSFNVQADTLSDFNIVSAQGLNTGLDQNTDFAPAQNSSSDDTENVNCDPVQGVNSDTAQSANFNTTPNIIFDQDLSFDPTFDRSFDPAADPFFDPTYDFNVDFTNNFDFDAASGLSSIPTHDSSFDASQALGFNDTYNLGFDPAASPHPKVLHGCSSEPADVLSINPRLLTKSRPNENLSAYEVPCTSPHAEHLAEDANEKSKDQDERAYVEEAGDNCFDLDSLFGETIDEVQSAEKETEQVEMMPSYRLALPTGLPAVDMTVSPELIDKIGETHIPFTNVNSSSPLQNVNESGSQDIYTPCPPTSEIYGGSTGETLPGSVEQQSHNDTMLDVTMAQKQDSPSPQGQHKSRKQARVVRVNRQPRASKGQIDALVGFVSTGEAQNKLTSAIDSGTQQSHLTRATQQEYLPPFAMELQIFSTVEAAKKRLERAGPDVKYHLFRIENDDFHVVNNTVITYLGRLLFEALAHEPAAAPPQIPEADRAKYNSVQHDALERVKKTLNYHETRDDARARCVILVDTAFRLHVRGIPVPDLDREKFQKGKLHASGYLVDAESTFYLRMHKILFVLTTNKLVACDVMNGVNIDAIVRSPREYVHRKVLNYRGNDTKAKLTEKGLEAVSAQTSPEEAAQSSPDADRASRGRKRKAIDPVDPIDLTVPDAPKKPKAMPPLAPKVPGPCVSSINKMIQSFNPPPSSNPYKHYKCCRLLHA